MAYRKRRKSKGLWLPLIANTPAKGQVGQDIYPVGQRWGLLTTLTNTIVTGFVPLVPDTRGFAQVTNTVSEWSDDITQYGWMCKRVLGQIWCGIEAATADTWANIRVTAGVFVADEDPSAQNIPAAGVAGLISADGTAAAFAATLDYSPQANSALTRPWMWRRSWIMQNPLSTHVGRSLIGSNQNNFAFAPGLSTGPYVDIKSRRHIKPGERLFLAVSASPWDSYAADDSYGSTTAVRIFSDLRVFGSLTRPRPGGVF